MNSEATASPIAAPAEWEVTSTHRSGGIDKKSLIVRADKGRALEVNLVRFDGSNFFSPKHRHGWDQVRIGLQGATKYGSQRIKPRVVGYFPEGTYYGPQTTPEPSLQAIWQFDGQSKVGYITLAELDQATAALRHTGTFSGGYYRPNDGGRKIDANQASWEYFTKRPLNFPAARYPEPIYMNMDAFPWKDVDGSGIRHKVLGKFGEPDTTIEMYEVAQGAALNVSKQGRRVTTFVLEGGISAGDGKIGKWDALLSDENDAIVVRGDAAISELVLVTLP